MEVLNGAKGMFVDGEPMVVITNHEGVDCRQLWEEQVQQSQKVHRSQGIGGMRRDEQFAEMFSEAAALWKFTREGGTRLLKPLFSRNAQPQPVFRHELEHAQQQFRVFDTTWLLQQDKSIHHREVGV